MNEMLIVFQRHEFVTDVQYKAGEYRRRQTGSLVDWYKKEQNEWDPIFDSKLYDELEFSFMNARSL